MLAVALAGGFLAFGPSAQGQVTTVIENSDAGWTVTGGIQDYDPSNESLPAGSNNSVITLWESSHSAEITFTGTRVRIIGVRHNAGASATIRIDGAVVGTPSWFASTPSYETIFESAVLASGTHTLRIENPGDWINVDYIEVDDTSSMPITTVIENSDAGWTVTGGIQDYDPSNESLPAGSNSSVITLWESSHSAEITFTGTRVRIIGVRHNAGASATIRIDGALVGTPSWFASTPSYETIFESAVLASGTHTLRIENPGDWINIDYIEVDDTSSMPISVTGVSVVPSNLSLDVGATSALSATVSPSNATDPTVSWSTSNSSVATVSGSGVVTAIAPGSATITVTTADGGFTDTCVVTVNSGGGGTLQLPRGGVNITWQNLAYFSGSAALTNAMKNSSDWLNNPTFATDANGYPTSLAPGQLAERFIYFDTMHYPAGNYTLIWEGTGSLSIDTCDASYNFTPTSARTQTIPVTTTCDEGIFLTISATQVGDHIRNIRLYLPGYDDSSSFWTDHYVAFHAQFGVTRVAWGSGLYSQQTNWADRSEVADISWSDTDENPEENNGLPFEAMVDLANEANTDLWICAPVRGNSTFYRNMAELILTGIDPATGEQVIEPLEPGLRLWVEWGNEHWNCDLAFGYQGCIYIFEQVAQTGLDRPVIYAREALDLFTDVEAIFAANGASDRLITVLGGQNTNGWELETAAAEVDRLGRMSDVDVFTIAAYFYDELIRPAYNQSGVDGVFTAPQGGLSPMSQTIFDDLNGISGNGVETGRNFDVARIYNKPIVIYEGNHHLTSWIGMPAGSAAAISRDPRIYDEFRYFFDSWEAVDVVRTFVFFADIVQYNDEEAFGLKEYYDQPLSETHSLRAFLDWIAQPPLQK